MQKESQRGDEKMSMIPPVTFEVVMFFVIGAILSMFFHEGGHYLTAEKYKLLPTMKGLTVRTKYDGTPKQRMRIISNAVLFGFIPIAAVFLLIGVWSLFLIPIYLIGCKSDFIKYGEARGENERK